MISFTVIDWVKYTLRSRLRFCAWLVYALLGQLKKAHNELGRLIIVSA